MPNSKFAKLSYYPACWALDQVGQEDITVLWNTLGGLQSHSPALYLIYDHTYLCFLLTKTYYVPLPVSEHPHILAVSFCHWHLLFSHTAPLLPCQWPPRQHQWHRLTWRRVWGTTWYTQQCTMTGCNTHTQTRAAWVAKSPSSVTPYAIPTVDNFNVFQKYLRITCISVNTCIMCALTKGLIN